MASENILQVIDLCKSFHKLEVLKNISVSFNKNEVVSIICLLYTSPSPRDTR